MSFDFNSSIPPPQYSERHYYRHTQKHNYENSVNSLYHGGVELVSKRFYNNQLTTTSPNIINMINASSLEEDFWAIFDQQYLRHSLGWTVTLVVAYIIIFIIGIIGNLMVILVVAKRPQMRTVTNMFIVNLAVADLFVVAFCVPATLFSNVFTPWILGSIMCKGVAYVQGVSVCASAYSLAAISLDRCKAIFKPIGRSGGLSKHQALITICLIWLMALLLTIPWALYFDVVVSQKDGISYCVETWENETHGKIYFLVANLICCYSLPLTLISISNLAVWCHVSHRKVPQDSASAIIIKNMHKRTSHGVRKMLGIVTLAFLLSWLPLYVLVTRLKFAKNMSEWESSLGDILMPFFQWLGSMNSGVNPVLYAFLNSKFREMFKSFLPDWMCCIIICGSKTSTSTCKNLERINALHKAYRKERPMTSNACVLITNSFGKSDKTREISISKKNNDNQETPQIKSISVDSPSVAIVALERETVVKIGSKLSLPMSICNEAIITDL